MQLVTISQKKRNQIFLRIFHFLNFIMPFFNKIIVYIHFPFRFVKCWGKCVIYTLVYYLGNWWGKSTWHMAQKTTFLNYLIIWRSKAFWLGYKIQNRCHWVTLNYCTYLFFTSSKVIMLKYPLSFDSVEATSWKQCTFKVICRSNYLTCKLLFEA